MNWKDHAYLFANGKFYAMINDVTYLIIGTQIAPDSEVFYRLHDDVKDKRYIQHVDDIILVARPIEDMTDEEWEYFKENYGYDKEHKNGLILNLSNRDITFDLLSIGVYPFGQSHFDDGTVLNINEVSC